MTLANALEYPWINTGIAALLAALAALLIHRTAAAAARRLAASRPALQALVRMTVRPAWFALQLLALQIVWQGAPDDLMFIGALRHLTALALIGVFAWLAMRCVDALAEAAAVLNPLDTADNLRARRVQTQFRVIAQTVTFLIFLIAVSAALMTFPGVREIGASLLASAGVAGLVVGFAAKPVIGNLLAGLQIAITQPIRLDDVVIVEGEWGRIGEITGTYVVVHIWDERRLIVPLQWFIEHPFQNWTRESSEIVGAVFLWVDYRMPIQILRDELTRICGGAPEWDGRVCVTQVTDTNARAIQVRMLVSAMDSAKCWDLRCRVREEMIAFVQRDYPQFLPRLRLESGDALPAPTQPQAA